MSGSDAAFLRWLVDKTAEPYRTISDGTCCCNASQIEAFIVIGVTALLTGLLWHSVVFSPLKLIAVFLHEFGHASATWLTCGKVTVTWEKIPTRIAAVVFMVSAVATTLILRIKDKRVCGSRLAFGMILRCAIIFVAAVPAGLWVLEEKVEMKVHPLRWCMLVMGTVCTLHAVYDCLHDVLFKKIDNEAQVSYR
ncbi:uncharacterized protein LOC129614976 [Condylostylus longicornis]|uniref:uncharacterized protein LOC129614976 n=1 Tax=Condylostylus longicornis TaxID=2530218 RepID=UPI00244DD757|nr:uncharacterized protein LOC129614976 [Condylostylus longicornis]